MIVAPSGPQSGVGHAVTTGEGMHLEAHGPTRYGLDGTPRELQAGTGMAVIEVDAADTATAQQVLQATDEAASVTQLGMRLRVLVPTRHAEPELLVRARLQAAGVEASARLASPSLEDVFVAATLKDAA